MTDPSPTAPALPAPPDGLALRDATADDAATVLAFIRELAIYEKLEQEVVADEELLRHHVFSEPRRAEVVIASLDGRDVGFALFFHNFSTFRGRPGIYLEDLFVREEARGHGVGLALLRHLARLARERDCARLEWVVLDWNRPAIDFYERLGAAAMDEWRTFRLTGDALERLAAS